MSNQETHKWEFKARFRRGAFGWKSQPAIRRVKEAVAEIRKEARRDPVLAAEGAVLFLERVSPALEHVDSSSGSIGTAVNNAIAALVPLITGAPADAETRADWLERLFQAHGDDHIPYIESLAESWGALCASKDAASAWADRLLDAARMALDRDKDRFVHFHGTSACLSALHAAGRHDDIIQLLEKESFWHYKRWAVKALAALGRMDEAIRLAEASRGPWSSDMDIDGLCEEMLLSSGRVEDAYARYGLTAHRGATYVSTFRAVAKRYPHKRAGEILSDLVKTTPGEEAKWFAAAKDNGLFAEAIQLARCSPCDPKTLARAARDHGMDHPSFAVDAGLLALYWISLGFGYEVSGADVWTAYISAWKAAGPLGRAEEVRASVCGMTDSARSGAAFIKSILGSILEPS